jgi:hypothetical protein
MDLDPLEGLFVDERIPFRDIIMYIISHVHLDILTIRNLDNKTPLECIEIARVNEAVLDEFLEAIDYRRQELECFPVFK